MERRRTPRLSLDLLRGFQAAARHLSFTRAARELFVSQPAISQEIKVLEQQLGTPLFSRSNRTLQLTQAGQELLQAAEEALSIIDAAAERVSGASRTFTVTTTVPLASLWLRPRLAHFTRLHPSLNMRVIASDNILDLDREYVDVAIRYVRKSAPTPPGQWLCDYEMFPVCAPALACKGPGAMRSAKDLERHVLLDLETVVNGRPWSDWQHWFDAKRLRPIRPAGVLRFSHYDQVVEAAVEGSGIAIGKRPHLGRHLQAGKLLAPLGVEGVAVTGGFYIVVSKSAPDAITRAFTAWLQAEARQHTDPERVAQPRIPARSRAPKSRSSAKRR